VFTTAAVSIAVHGISVTPLMSLYERWSQRGAEQGEGKRANRTRGVLNEDDDLEEQLANHHAGG
jgi:hypothetical protein